MSAQEITDLYRDELELFAEHAARLAESIGVRNEVGHAIALVAHGVDTLLNRQ